MKNELDSSQTPNNYRRIDARLAHFLRIRQQYVLIASLLAIGFVPQPAQASIFKGETLDTVANVMSWVVLVVVPIVAVVAFWLVHILPEKIAEKKKHPQAKAIQTLCLLSLFFGGILWPLAWLWAYTKPVLHKLAYGTDVDESHGKDAGHAAPANVDVEKAQAAEAELQRIRQQVMLLAEQLQVGTKGRNA